MTGMGFDSVTFPGMGPLWGKYVSKRQITPIFFHKIFSSIVFSCISASYFLEMGMSIRWLVDLTITGTGFDSVTFPGKWPGVENMFRK